MVSVRSGVWVRKARDARQMALACCTSQIPAVEKLVLDSGVQARTEGIGEKERGSHVVLNRVSGAELAVVVLAPALDL